MEVLIVFTQDVYVYMSKDTKVYSYGLILFNLLLDYFANDFPKFTSVFRIVYLGLYIVFTGVWLAVFSYSIIPKPLSFQAFFQSYCPCI